MGSEDRLAALNSLVEKKPDDPFPRYGLAMEYSRLGRAGDAIAAFSHLLDRHPDYVPTYYQAGMALAAAGDRQRAQQVLRDGAAVADRLGNVHAGNELREALSRIMEEAGL